eukprot:GGOE01056823.1.p2 GENE.GGOE01056823.1~~GGOE01056823.1.p2  ORF type:complete len:132 (+),score=46.79 GGOE01056823.1:72-467(+)
MGKATKRGRKPHGAKKKVPKQFKARKVDTSGNVRRRKGDVRSIWRDYTVRAKVIGQRQGGKVVADTKHRVCMLHSKCDCVMKTDMSRMARVGNMDGSLDERDEEREVLRMLKLKGHSKRPKASKSKNKKKR